MWRSFLTLYGVVLAALLLSFVAISVPLNYYLDTLVQEEVERTTSGIFHLLEQEFEGVDRDDYPRVIADLNRLFPYGVALLSPQEVAKLDLNRVGRKALESGHIAFVQYPREMMLKRLGSGDAVLQLNWEHDLTRENQVLAIGPIKLIGRRLAPLPEAQWPAVIAQLQPYFGFPVELYRFDELELPAPLREQVADGLIATQRLEGNHEIIYGRVLDSDYVFKAGPIISEIRFSNYLLLLVPVVIVALAILLWLASLGKDVRKLNHTTRRFGEGDLQARVSLRRHSTLFDTGERFNGMAGDIERLIESSRELTNAVSHDLKTPLARMRFALEMLQQKSSDVDSQRFVRSLEEDVAELESLVEELLANARYERQLALQREPVGNLYKWVSGIAERIRRQYPDLEIEMVDRVPPASVVSLDRKALARALGNVLDNALRFARTRVRVEVAVSEGRASIAVDDDGLGIPEADRDKVLKPFVRLESSRKRGGHGLGLAIAGKIMVQHNGSIEIRCAESGGALVRLSWPV
jgi:signal transduction histidine kinase